MGTKSRKMGIITLFLIIMLSLGAGCSSRNANNQAQDAKEPNRLDTSFEQANQAVQNAGKETCFENQRMIEAAVQSYQIDHNTYPNDAASLVAAGYLRTAPICPEAKAGYTIDTNGKVVPPAACPHGRYDASQ
ncbi:MAG: hypothetical protein ACM3NJ_00735 [Methanobacterium sp.]